MANLDSIVIVDSTVGEDGVIDHGYLKVNLKQRTEAIFIYEDDKNYAAYLGIFKLKEAQIQQYLENIRNKDND